MWWATKINFNQLGQNGTRTRRKTPWFSKTDQILNFGTCKLEVDNIRLSGELTHIKSNKIPAQWKIKRRNCFFTHGDHISLPGFVVHPPKWKIMANSLQQVKNRTNINPHKGISNATLLQKNYTPGSLTWPPKNGGWKITFLVGLLIFRGYVKLPGGQWFFSIAVVLATKNCCDPSNPPKTSKICSRDTKAESTAWALPRHLLRSMEL